MTRAKVQPRGQITLPKEVRRRAGIQAGDLLHVDVLGDGEIRLTVLPRRTPRELREIYPIDAEIDWHRDREAAEEEAAKHVIGR